MQSCVNRVVKCAMVNLNQGVICAMECIIGQLKTSDLSFTSLWLVSAKKSKAHNGLRFNQMQVVNFTQ